MTSNRFCSDRLSVREQMAALRKELGETDASVEIAARLQTRSRATDGELFARCYGYDRNGKRVLLGLTIEETREFELLDSLPPCDEDGNLLPWLWGGAQPQGAEARWLELYLKHEGVCRLRWFDPSDDA